MFIVIKLIVNSNDVQILDIYGTYKHALESMTQHVERSKCGDSECLLMTPNSVKVVNRTKGYFYSTKCVQFIFSILEYNDYNDDWISSKQNNVSGWEEEQH